MPEHRILLAEDGLVNQIFTQEILDQMGHHVRIVSNGLEAVEAIENGNYHLVLMDCRMPKLDGFAATKLIRNNASNSKRAQIPIIALTANAMEGDEEKCIQAGMNDYLTKPFAANELREKINYWLNPIAQDEPLIDLNAVEETKKVLGHRYNEIYDSFIDDVSNALTEIQQYLPNGIPADLTRPAHTIKSTAKLMGAMKLAAIAADLEKYTITPPHPYDPAFIRHRLWHLQNTFKQTIAKLSAQKNMPASSQHYA